MLKQFLYPIFIFSMIFVISSCGFSDKARNNENLTELKRGMSKPEVLAIMGEPLKKEIYNTDNTWYYFTQVKWSDGMITKDECTPVFFKDNKLAGWGQIEYKIFRQQNWESHD